MTSAFNRHAGSMANLPAGCTIENELLAWLCQKAGFSSQAGGSGTFCEESFETPFSAAFSG